MSQSLTAEVNRAARPDPLKVLEQIIAAIPDGLKDENGNLKPAYPNEKVGFFDREALWFDAATLADVACYNGAVYSGNQLIKSYVFQIPVLLEKLAAITSETANEEFKRIVSEASDQRDQFDGRQTDFEDAINWHKRRDIAKAYERSLQVQAVPVTENLIGREPN